ncbi:MAG: DUF2089 family protein [Acholeplasmatales bacterium]|jgi:hypothetical protein|nr:DUF2089 domain-containing protein [Acholeplasmataceae bacterium]MDY0115778.1 DUF2089 family protein [Acholeplasmatales bacterium]MCK9289898.1 DUF2089 domain-containing protein [Acholeplasmataceae bacterium]MCK9428128.1 DUF2089 domain-containing protein [Acholeplasmataceae bacterium]MDD4090691.1 DUF2089 family protein [Acholeplasmataceae bacterium]
MSIPTEWTALLEEEDWNFIKQFVLYSGSLKEMAKYYDVTYPTVRLRLDRIIQKIQLTEKSEDDEFVIMIKKLTIDDQLDYKIARKIITEYRKDGK